MGEGGCVCHWAEGRRRSSDRWRLPVGHTAWLGKPRRRKRLNWRFIYPIRCQGRHIEESWPLRVLTKCQNKKKNVRRKEGPRINDLCAPASTCQRLLRPSFNGCYCCLSERKETETFCPLVSLNNTHTHTYSTVHTPYPPTLTERPVKLSIQGCYIDWKEAFNTISKII